jgi:hyperosmotically inducible protein
MHSQLKVAFCAFIVSGTLLLSGPLAARAAQNHEPDNTSVNKQDRDASKSTADQAKNNTSDREMARHIRQDVVHDKSLSTYGHNVKIIAKDGKVTLRGPVHSEDEKRAIEDHAKKYAGDGNVTNEVTVKADREHK